LVRSPPFLLHALLTSPSQLNQEIAHHIESDKDLCAFAATCQETSNAVQSDGGSFWNHRFRARYALKAGSHDNEQLKKKYQRRRKWLRRMSNISFEYGHTEMEVKSLAVMSELINESFSGQALYDEYGRRTCRNLDELSRFIESSSSLSRINRVSPTGRGDVTDDTYNWTLAAIQLMYSHVLFDTNRLWNHVFAFEHSQKMVYASAVMQPMFTGMDRNYINMEYILHIMNFFRYHMMRDGESHALYEAYKELSALEKPSAWDRKLKQHDDHIGDDWRGTYAYLEPKEISQIRSITGTKKNMIFMDKNVDGSNNENPIHSSHLDPSVRNLFSTILKAHPTLNEPRTRAEHRTRSRTPPRKPQPISLEGEGEDDGKFYASGWLSELPVQEGIAGWKRMSFIKYYADAWGSVDTEALWGYEGVVLPGGKMCLGRWWAVDRVEQDVDGDENLYSGPFILWNVHPKMAKGEA
ncbi:uncharacterized protein BDZ99DRAFT_543772, partial [Mytilinidion resinicola]